MRKKIKWQIPIGFYIVGLFLTYLLMTSTSTHGLDLSIAGNWALLFIFSIPYAILGLISIWKWK